MRSNPAHFISCVFFPEAARQASKRKDHHEAFKCTCHDLYRCNVYGMMKNRQTQILNPTGYDHRVVAKKCRCREIIGWEEHTLASKSGVLPSTHHP